jgi:hypothetical protein
MDINYHYFAVKTLALKAGFSEDDAQIIAAYSQFVDDFSNTSYMPLQNVPPFAQRLATKVPGTNTWFFNPATTGFESFLDTASLFFSDKQRNILIPFHFIPPGKKLNEAAASRTEWRVVPARLDQDSLIKTLLLDARTKYMIAPNRANLIRIGALLHIFADTYAHQGFSGWHGWENYAYLEHATNNINGRDILDSYSPNIYHEMLSIGHANVNHAPDDSNISFDMRMCTSENDRDYSLHLGRSNTRTFSTVSKEILNYLLSCRGLERYPDREWEPFSDKVELGFLTLEKEIAVLVKHWKKIFPAYSYHYRKDDQLKSVPTARRDVAEMQLITDTLNALGDEYSGKISREVSAVMTVMNDDFYHFNIIADDIRQFVNGAPVVQREWNELARRMAAIEDAR